MGKKRERERGREMGRQVGEGEGEGDFRNFFTSSAGQTHPLQLSCCRVDGNLTSCQASLHLT